MSARTDDDADRRLLDEVRPEGWTNPRPRKRYDLVVVGAGTAGLVSAAGAAGLGARVALVERDRMGGDCLNTGCVPSKGLIAAARSWSRAASTHRFGLSADVRERDFAAAARRMREVRASIAPHDGAARFAALGVDVFFGEGRFASERTVTVGDDSLRFRRAVIATGARASVLPVPGLEECGYHTNESIFDLDELPRRLLVVGAGPIGCELAQAFARFGSAVTIVDAADRVLPREDPDVSALVEDALARDGVRYVAGAEILRFDRNGAECQARVNARGVKETLAADAVLLSVGRTPNVDGLGLEQAGVEFGAEGVVVDRNLRTTNRRVFACGDVSSRFKFTHAADAEARIVIQNALFLGRTRADRLVVPWCTYTDPEVAHAGLNEAALEEAGAEFETVKIATDEVDRANLEGDTEGFLKIHVEKKKGRILGATFVAEGAGDMIPEIVLAMREGLTLDAIAATVHPYPTRAEAIKKAADAWRRGKLTPPVKRILTTVLRLLRYT